MLSAAAGPVASAVPLFAVPLLGALALDSTQFAVWAVLATISTLAVSLDFGGNSYLMANVRYESSRGLLLRACLLSGSGSVLVGSLGMAIWWPYSATDAAQGFGTAEGILAIGTLTVGSALRSALQVLAQLALYREVFVLRNVVLISHSFTYAAVTAGLLLSTRSAWALPIGWMTSSALLILPCLFWAHRSGVLDGQLNAELPPKATAMKQFVISRSKVTIVGGLLLQSDRWVVGALGGPVMLAAYEVAWRFAALPRFLAQHLSMAAAVDAPRLRDESPGDLFSFLKLTTRIAGLASLAASVVVLALYGISVHVWDLPSSWAYLSGMLVSFSLLSSTMPTSIVSQSLGMPELDLSYLYVAAILTVCGGVLAFLYAAPQVFVVVYLASLALSCVWFIWYGRARIMKRVGAL